MKNLGVMKKGILLISLIVLLVSLAVVVYADTPCTVQRPWGYLGGNARVYCPDDALAIATYGGTAENPTITLGKGAEATTYRVRVVENGYLQVHDGKWRYLIASSGYNNYVTSDKNFGKYFSSEKYFSNLDITKLPTKVNVIPVVSTASEGYYGFGIGADYTWRQGQIDSIKYTKYLGKSLDGYEYYEIDSPDGKGVLRVPPKGSNENVAFSINLGVDAQSIANAERNGDFYSVEIQDDPGSVFNDPELLREDLNLPVQVVIAPRVPIITPRPEPISLEEAQKRAAEFKRQTEITQQENQLKLLAQQRDAAVARQIKADQDKDSKGLLAATADIEKLNKQIVEVTETLTEFKKSVPSTPSTTVLVDTRPKVVPPPKASQSQKAKAAQTVGTFTVTDKDGNPIETFVSEKAAKTYISTYPSSLGLKIKKGDVKAVLATKVEKRKLGDKFIVTVGNKVIKKDGKQLFTEQEAEEILNQQKRIVLEKNIQNTYTPLGFSAGDDSGSLIIQDRKTKAFHKAILKDDGTIEYTQLPEGQSFTATTQVGGKDLQVVYRLEKGQATIQSLLGVPIDKKTFDEISKQAGGKKGTGLITADKGTIQVRDKLGNLKYDVTPKKDGKITNLYQPIFGIYSKVQTTETTGDLTTVTNQQYLFKQGNQIISPREFQKLQKEDAPGLSIQETPQSETTFSLDEEGKRVRDTVSIYDTTYGLDFKQGKGTLTFIDKYDYDKNGKQVGYTYIQYKDGKEVGRVSFDKDGKETTKEGDVDENKAKSARTQAKARIAYQSIEFALTEFTGLSAYSQFLFSEETLDSWRDNVDSIFDNVILGGTDYWTSQICATQYDKSDLGVAYTLTPAGILQPSAHIESERSSPITLPGKQTEYLYKITFYVKASVKDIRFNVQLKGDETTELYSEDLLLKGDSDGSGEAFSATNERAVVQYSSSLYTEVCLDFSEGDIEDICNIIPESDYSKDNFIKAGEDSGLQAGERASEDSGPVIKQI